jgi:hypothetical protein
MADDEDEAADMDVESDADDDDHKTTDPVADDARIDELRSLVVATADYTVYAYDFNSAATRYGTALRDNVGPDLRRAERQLVLGHGLDERRMSQLCGNVADDYVAAALSTTDERTVKYVLWPTTRAPPDVPGVAVVERQDGDRAHIEIVCNRTYNGGGRILLEAIETDLTTRYPATAWLDLNALDATVVPFYLAHGYRLDGPSTPTERVHVGDVGPEGARPHTVHLCYALGSGARADDEPDTDNVVVAALTVPRPIASWERTVLNGKLRHLLVIDGARKFGHRHYVATVVERAPRVLDDLRTTLRVAWAELAVAIVVASAELDMSKRLRQVPTDADARDDALIDALRTVVAVGSDYAIYRYDFDPAGAARHDAGDGPPSDPVSAEQRVLERQVVVGRGSEDVTLLCPTVPPRDVEQLFRSTQAAVVKYLLWSSRPLERRHDLPGLAVVERAGTVASLQLLCNQTYRAGGATLLAAVVADMARRYPSLTTMRAALGDDNTANLAFFLSQGFQVRAPMAVAATATVGSADHPPEPEQTVYVCRDVSGSVTDARGGTDHVAIAVVAVTLPTGAARRGPVRLRVTTAMDATVDALQRPRRPPAALVEDFVREGGPLVDQLRDGLELAWTRLGVAVFVGPSDMHGRLTVAKRLR